MKALRFAASVLIIAAILALYRTLLPVNNTTVALTLLLAILGRCAKIVLRFSGAYCRLRTTPP